MSRYIRNLADALETALAGVPRADAAKVCGYWANRDFWLAEFDHLVRVIDGFDGRLAKMTTAHDDRARADGRSLKRDELGLVSRTVSDTTSPRSRREWAGGARAALKRLADRARDVGAASRGDYDGFVRGLRITGRDPAGKTP